MTNYFSFPTISAKRIVAAATGLFLFMTQFVVGIGSAEAGEYSARELEVVFYQLSYIESEHCLEMLSSIGYNTGKPSFPISEDDLPVVFPLPESQNISVVGSGTLDKVGDGAPQQRIGIMYHSARAEDYSELLRFIDQYVDIKATQVQIEAMVVELTEEARRELGLEYQWRKVNPLQGESADNLADFSQDLLAEFDSDSWFNLRYLNFEVARGRLFEAELRAMIRDQVAEVLSAPSVLTLDNRHAKIEIMKQVPIIEKSERRDVDRWEMDISYEDVGIILNIKPRVDRSGEWVTLQVQTEVSEDLDYIEIDGEPVAPIIERRIVETIARIRNNHPFIVGGLIRDDSSETVRKVPFLGEIPLAGRLFQSRETVQEKREVIIVLTPRVIRPEASDRPVMPKDSETFDFFDTRLFRETYTLKAEDVYDLDFILERPAIARVLDAAREVIEQRPQLMEQEPFRSVAGDRIPGESAIVNRMLYGVVRKLGLYEEVKLDRLIYFEPDEADPAGFRVNRLVSALRDVAGDLSVEEYLEQDYPKDVLFFTFTMPDHDEADTEIDYPVARTMVEHHESSRSAERRLHELGRLDGLTRPQIAFMVSDARELERLKTSIVVRSILEVNDPDVIQRLANFDVGRRIAIPEIDPAQQRSFLLDRGVAVPFYMSHFYYAEFEEKFRRYINRIQEELELDEDLAPEIEITPEEVDTQENPESGENLVTGIEITPEEIDVKREGE